MRRLIGTVRHFRGTLAEWSAYERDTVAQYALHHAFQALERETAHAQARILLTLRDSPLLIPRKDRIR